MIDLCTIHFYNQPSIDMLTSADPSELETTQL